MRAKSPPLARQLGDLDLRDLRSPADLGLVPVPRVNDDLFVAIVTPGALRLIVKRDGKQDVNADAGRVGRVGRGVERAAGVGSAR